MYERGLILWIREQSAYCHDLNFNSGGGGRTPKDVARCGGSAWFTGGPTEVVAKAKKKKKKKLSACRGEGSVVGLQLRVRFVPAALLAMLSRTALAPRCVSKARDWTGHVYR